MSYRPRHEETNVTGNNFSSSLFSTSVPPTMKLLYTIKRYALRTVISITILMFFILYASQNPSWRWEFIGNFIQGLENQAYDIRLKLTLPKTRDPRIVIVDIDEKSLKEMGRWPWSRDILAQLIDQLFDLYKIKVLGMDIVFAERDESSGLKQLETLAQGPLKQSKEFLNSLETLRPLLEYDKRFAQSLQNRKIVLGYIFTSSQDKLHTGQLPEPILSAEDTQAYQLDYEEGDGYAANLPLFQQKAIAAGHFNSVPDSDGIVRKVPLFYGYHGALYEFLSLTIARIALGAEYIQLGINTQGGEASLDFIQIADRQIPLDKKLKAWVPYRGTRETFTYISATDVLHGRASPNVLNNAIVLLGTSAQGLVDLRATPIESIFPGVEIHANVISGLLDQKIKYNLSYENVLEVLLLFVIGLLMMIFLPLLSPVLATISTFLLVGGVMEFNFWMWNQHDIVFPIVSTVLLILSLFVFNMSYGYFVETRNRRHLMKRFGQYIPPELVEEMNQHLDQKFSMDAESREMTVLFSDVRGFTTISEGLEPKVLAELMNEYLTPMTRIIHEHRGTIDKYMGDAIMAFWGAPLHDPQHARHAIDTAMNMLERLHDIHSQFQEKGWPKIKIGIGLNTGLMSVGNMGSEFRMAYTVLGDAVNLGSRLEGITKQYGVQLIVSETTKNAAPEYIYRELDWVRVKGKDKPVAIFEPIGLQEKISEEECLELVSYEKALQTYRHQHWETAQEQFAQLQEKYPQHLLYTLYIRRIEYFKNQPPGQDWDGVYIFTEK